MGTGPQSGVAPDGGWGYVIMMCSFMVAFLVDGVGNSYGLLLPIIADKFQVSVPIASLPAGLFGGITQFVGPITARLVQRFGCRPVAFMGGIITASAVIAASFSPNIEMFIVCYGIGSGVGNGLIYLPSITTVNAYFDRKRSVVMGLVTCGSGIGLLVMATLIERLLALYGLRGCLMILSACFLNFCVCASLLRPLTSNSNSKEKKGGEGGDSSSNDSCSTDVDMTCSSDDGRDNSRKGSDVIREKVKVELRDVYERSSRKGVKQDQCDQTVPGDKMTSYGIITSKEAGTNEANVESNLFISKDKMTSTSNKNTATNSHLLKLLEGKSLSVIGTEDTTKTTESVTDYTDGHDLRSRDNSDLSQYTANLPLLDNSFDTRSESFIRDESSTNGNDIKRYEIENSEQTLRLLDNSFDTKSESVLRDDDDFSTNIITIPKDILTVEHHNDIQNGGHTSSSAGGQKPFSFHEMTIPHLDLANGSSSLNDVNALSCSWQEPSLFRESILPTKGDKRVRMSGEDIHYVTGPNEDDVRVHKPHHHLHHRSRHLEALTASMVRLPQQHHTTTASNTIRHRGGDISSKDVSVSMLLLNQPLETTAASSLSLASGISRRTSMVTEIVDIEETIVVPESSPFSQKSLLDDPVFVLYCAGAMLVQLANNLPAMFLPSYAAVIGLSSGQAANVVAILGISNTVGRFLAGLMSFMGLGSIRIYNAGISLAGVACLLIHLWSSYVLLIVFATCFGFFLGVIPPLQSVILVELLGIERLPSSFGIMCLCKSIATMAAPSMAGSLFEVFQDYKVTFTFGGSLFLLAAGLHVIMAFLRRRALRKACLSFHDEKED